VAFHPTVKKIGRDAQSHWLFVLLLQCLFAAARLIVIVAAVFSQAEPRGNCSRAAIQPPVFLS
jgi:hypothetical protein